MPFGGFARQIDDWIDLTFYLSDFSLISRRPAASLRLSFLFTLTSFFQALFHHRLLCFFIATFPIIVLQSAAPCLDASCPVSVCARTHSSCGHLAGPPPFSGLMPLQQTLTRSAACTQKEPAQLMKGKQTPALSTRSLAKYCLLRSASQTSWFIKKRKSEQTGQISEWWKDGAMTEMWEALSASVCVCSRFLNSVSNWKPTSTGCNLILVPAAKTLKCTSKLFLISW